MSKKPSTVKVTERYGKTVLATVTLTPTDAGGAEAAWTVTLDGVVIGRIDRRRESQMFAIANSRLGSPGAVRTYWDGEGPGGLRDKATHTTYNETRLDVLRPLVENHRKRVAMAAAREEAKNEQHYLRVENLPGYAMPTAPAGVVYAGYWMDFDRNVPVAVFRSTDAAALAAFAATVDGKRFWEDEGSTRGSVTVALTDDAAVAVEGHGYDKVFDKVTAAAAAKGA
jgi:hypothetical protein